MTSPLHPVPETSDKIDWSQLWYPGPTRQFSPEELARAGQDLPSRTFLMVLGLNLAVLALFSLQLAPAAEVARWTGLLAAMAVLGWRGLMALWRQPTRRRLAWLTGVGTVLLLGLLLGLRERVADPEHRRWLIQATNLAWLGFAVAFWLVATYRSQQIAGRLRELAERDQAVALAAQLMAAQIQPHFLFNSLATLQHWVQTKDDRAAPLLQSLTTFLRATLPLFNRPQLQLAEELDAVRSYLAVMQARLGERLQTRFELPEALMALPLPPGLLLTLVENAVEHGVQARLDGATLTLRGRLDGAGAVLEVADTGPGLAPGHAEGTGLSNSRARLNALWGADARLRLENDPAGGCIARLHLDRLTPRGTAA